MQGWWPCVHLCSECEVRERFDRADPRPRAPQGPWCSPANSIGQARSPQPNDDGILLDTWPPLSSYHGLLPPSLETSLQPYIAAIPATRYTLRRTNYCVFLLSVGSMEERPIRVSPPTFLTGWPAAAVQWLLISISCPLITSLSTIPDFLFVFSRG